MEFNSDDLLGKNSDLFDLTEDDLIIPESILFPKSELIEGTVLDCHSVDKIGAVKLEVMLSNTDHAGKCHSLLVKKPRANKETGVINPTAKKMWAEFLLAFWTREQILGKQVDMASVIGKRISYRAGASRDWEGKTYQDFNTFKVQE